MQKHQKENTVSGIALARLYFPNLPNHRAFLAVGLGEALDKGFIKKEQLTRENEEAILCLFDSDFLSPAEKISKPLSALEQHVFTFDEFLELYHASAAHNAHRYDGDIIRQTFLIMSAILTDTVTEYIKSGQLPIAHITAQIEHIRHPNELFLLCQPEDTRIIPDGYTDVGCQKTSVFK